MIFYVLVSHAGQLTYGIPNSALSDLTDNDM